MGLSDEETIFDPDREGAFTWYMHEPGHDDRLDARPRGYTGRAYAPFLLNRYTRWNPRARIATIYYLTSTSIPYQVMIMISARVLGCRVAAVQSLDRRVWSVG